jgi:hypothetical protein
VVELRGGPGGPGPPESPKGPPIKPECKGSGGAGKRPPQKIMILIVSAVSTDLHVYILVKYYINVLGGERVTGYNNVLRGERVTVAALALLNFDLGLLLLSPSFRRSL